MRVIAGEWRGRPLVAPAGGATRPTADRVREALFSILGRHVIDAVVLDLFAGSGALGLEALSRGSARATFVDCDPGAVTSIGANLARLDVAPERGLLQSIEAEAFVRHAVRRGEKYDLVFVDPPYDMTLDMRLTNELPLLLDADARLVCESPRSAPPRFSLPLVRERAYGNTVIRIHCQ